MFHCNIDNLLVLGFNLRTFWSVVRHLNHWATTSRGRTFQGNFLWMLHIIKYKSEDVKKAQSTLCKSQSSVHNAVHTVASYTSQARFDIIIIAVLCVERSTLIDISLQIYILIQFHAWTLHAWCIWAMENRSLLLWTAILAPELL